MIVVTGGSGFIGRHLMAGLVAAGIQAIICDRRPAPDISGVARSPLVDVTDLEAVVKITRGADTVFHLAGPVASSVVVAPYDTSALQLMGTLNVLEACRRNAVRHLVLASSSYVYSGLDSSQYVDEETPIGHQPMHLFGAQKLCAEHLAHAYATTSDIECTTVRIGSAFGRSASSNLIGDILCAAATGQPAELRGAGLRRIQLTAVDDIVDALIRCIAAPSGIINVISPEATTIQTLGGLLTSLGVRVVWATAQPEGPTFPYISARKAIHSLGWHPRGFEDALSDVVRHSNLT